MTTDSITVSARGGMRQCSLGGAKLLVAGSKDIVFCANGHSLLSPFRAQCVGRCHPHLGPSLLGVSFWDWPHRHTRDCFTGVPKASR